MELRPSDTAVTWDMLLVSGGERRAICHTSGVEDRLAWAAATTVADVATFTSCAAVNSIKKMVW